MDVIGLMTHLVQGISIGFVASIPVGPIAVMIIQRTLNKGRQSGFVSGLGAATSDLIYAIIAGFSVSFIMNFVEEQKKLLSILGAVVLICIGLKIFLTNPITKMRERQQQQIRLKQLESHMDESFKGTSKLHSGLISDYFSTLFLTITNPLAIFLFLAMFSLVGGEKTIFTQIFLLMGVFAGASVWWLMLTLLVGLFRKKLTLKRLYYINKIAGGIIIVSVMGALLYEFISEIIIG